MRWAFCEPRGRPAGIHPTHFYPLRLLRRRWGFFAHGEIPQTGGGPILHSLSLAPTEAAVSPTAPPLSASPRGLGRCHAPCSAPFGVSTRARTLSRPLLRPFRRAGPLLRPFCRPRDGGLGRDGERTDSLWFLLVVQVQPKLTFTENKFTAHKDRWKSNCSLN